jgi:hypothetical protein
MALASVATGTARAVLMDLGATAGLHATLFIDDTILARSSLWGIRRAGKALTEFVTQRAHAFAQGAKGARVMVFGTAQPATEQLGEVAGTRMQTVDPENPTMKALGVRVGAELGFDPLLREILAKLAGSARQIFAATQSTGFGLPYQVAQMGAADNHSGLVRV